MKLFKPQLKHARVIACGLVLGIAGAISPARADSDDYRDARWREHQRQEQAYEARAEAEARADARARRHAYWDHRYWDRDDDRRVEVYRPPAVYYAAPPPTGLDFVFRFGR